MGRSIWGADRPRKWTKSGPGLIRKADKLARKAGQIHTLFLNDLSDFFEDHSGAVVDANNEQMFWPHNSVDTPRYIPASHCAGDEPPVTLSDLRQDGLALIDSTTNLIFQLLTKRPENCVGMLARNSRDAAGNVDCSAVYHRPNLWLGTSASEQKTANENWDKLRECGVFAARLFMSLEPLLGPIDLEAMWLDGPKPDWIIVGGESGPGARMCHAEWILSIVRQCRRFGVRCFVKQLGSEAYRAPDDWDKSRGFTDAQAMKMSLAHAKGGDLKEWPTPLQVREMPPLEIAS